MLLSIPILPITLINDWLWLLVFSKMGFVVDTSAIGTIINAWLNLTDIAITILYVDLVNYVSKKI